MKIHGLQKMTLLDYPGHVACTVFLGGCDLRCPYCHNYELATGAVEPVMEEEEFFAFLKKRTGLLDGVASTGGGPCLHRDLPAFMRRIREMGFSVKLDTNGTHPAVLREILDERLADYVAMDIKNSPVKYALTAGLTGNSGAPAAGAVGRSDMLSEGPGGEPVFLAAIRESIALIMHSGIDYEFRTTVVDEMHETDDFEEIGKMIEGAKRYFLQCFTDRETVPFSGLSAPSKEKLEACAARISGHVESVQIRGVD